MKRSYPRRLFKGKDDVVLVHSEVEEVERSLQGYESHWNPEIIERRKGTDREVLRFTEENQDEVKNVAENDVELPSMEQHYTNTTGKRAICDRGPYKGQETKGFKDWKLKHDDME